MSGRPAAWAPVLLSDLGQALASSQRETDAGTQQRPWPWFCQPRSQPPGRHGPAWPGGEGGAVLCLQPPGTEMPAQRRACPPAPQARLSWPSLAAQVVFKCNSKSQGEGSWGSTQAE